MTDRMTLILELGAMTKQAEKRGDNPSAATLRAAVELLIADQAAVERDAERRKGQRDRKQRSRVTVSHGTSRDVTLQSVTESQGFPGPLPNSETATATTTSTASAWQPGRESDIAARLTTDAGRNALAAVMHVAAKHGGSKDGVVGEVEACLAGMRGAQYAADAGQMDIALSDYASNGFTKGAWNATHFRACVRRAVEGPRAPAPVARRPASESWSSARDRKEREESERALVATRWGNVEQRRAKPDGQRWWSRMQSEAKALGANPVLYAFDRQNEPAEVTRVSA